MAELSRDQTSRALGDYDRLFEASESPFTPTDLLSLIALVHTNQPHASDTTERMREYRAQHADYYLKAANAVGRGLDISDDVQTWLSNENGYLALLKEGDDAAQNSIPFSSLMRLRDAVRSFRGVFAGVLEGDPLYRFESPKTSLHGRILEARKSVGHWYQSAQSSAEAGLGPIDRAICLTLGWNPDATISYEALRVNHGYPDPSTYDFD